MIHLSESESLQSKTAALTVLTENANKALADRSLSLAGKKEALSALMAAEWSPATVRSIGSKALNRLLHLVRSDVMKGEEYRNFADMITLAADPAQPSFHGQWDLWKSAITRFHLYEIAEQGDWKGLVAQLDGRGVLSPLHLQMIPFAELIKADWELSHPDMLIWLWQAAREDDGPNRPNLPFRLHTPSPDLQELIVPLRKKHIDSTHIALDYSAMKVSLGLPASFDGLSNANKCGLLERSGAEQLAILRLLNLGAQRNTLRAFAGSLRPAASGMQSYLNFCAFLKRPCFPVDSDTVLLWSALFRPNGTFGLYLSHVMKAAILLGQPTDWLTPKVRSAANGLRLAAGVSFAFGNFVIASDLLALLKAVKLASPFGLAAFLSFLLLLRLPSETLLIRRASDWGRLSEFAPHDFKILAGLRTFSGTNLSIVKFSRRKNLPTGCILRRPCLCDETSTLARIFCPVHQIWPRLCDGVEVHGRLFPSLTPHKFNIALKTGMTTAGYPEGGKYSPHCFRRGATKELQMAEQSTDVIKGAGCWAGMGFRSYVDTQMTGALKISRLITRIADSDSDEDRNGPAFVSASDKLRSKLKVFPIGQKRALPRDRQWVPWSRGCSIFRMTSI